MLSSSQQRAVLTSTILASSMAFIDSTALNVALPNIQANLEISASSLVWIVNGYALFLSALLLAGGAWGDTYGRNKVFSTGIIIFTVASVACGLSPNHHVLIIARCIQGIGAALMVPGSLAIITSLFPNETRGKAIGTRSMFSALTTVLGPALGGWLADAGWWRAIFFINVPIAATSLYFLRKVPESRSSDKNKTDTLGTILITVALACLTFGFIEAANYGFDHPVIYLSISAGFIAMIGFITQQYKTVSPLMPLWMFKSRIFSSANLITFLIYGALAGFLFFLPLNLIQVQGYTPRQAGLAMIPFGLAIAIFSKISGTLSDKIGIRTPLIFGPLLTTIAFFIFAQQGITAGPGQFPSTFLLPIILLGAGMGLTIPPVTTAVMSTSPATHMGAASGINNTVARTSAVLTIAILGALGMIAFKENMITYMDTIEMTPKQQEFLHGEISKLAEAQPPPDLSITLQNKVQAGIHQSFIYTFQQSALISAIMSAVSVLLTFIFIRNPKPLTKKR